MHLTKFLAFGVFFSAMVMYGLPCWGDIVVYRDAVDWANNTGASITTINWDDVSLGEGEFTTLASNHYAALPGSPLLSVDNTSSLYVGNPIFPSPSDEQDNFWGNSANPVSETNVFSLNVPDDAPSGPQGILTINFDSPVTAIGGWFLDVEGDFANTGIRVNGQLYAFESGFGSASQEFIGIVSDTAFTEAEFYMSANQGNGDGVLLDDLSYSSVPEPTSAAIFSVWGLACVAFRRRRKGSSQS